MPKLSSFVKRVKDPSDAPKRHHQQQQQQATTTTQRGEKKEAKGKTPSYASEKERSFDAKPAPRPELGISKQSLEEYKASKVFRWPDGSLRKEKPPSKRNVVLARKEWEDIVDYCRRTGGCEYCTKGQCLLHGYNVNPKDHERYCKDIGVWNQSLKETLEQIYMEGLSV